VEVEFSGVIGERYRLLASSNLVNWSTQITRTITGQPERVTDYSDAPFRSFRTVRVP
jgi:hypothetical protein